MNENKSVLLQWQNIIVYVMFAILPFFPKWMTPLVVIHFVLWLLGSTKKQDLQNFIKSLPLVLLTAFYAMHLLGLLWSSNFKYAGLDLQIKLPFLLLPITFAGFESTKHSQPGNAFKWFNGSLTLAIIICLGRATWFYFMEGSNLFFYKEFSCFLHPGYFSMFLCFGLVLLTKEITILNENGFSLSKTVFPFVQYLLFTLAIVLLASKGGVLLLLLILPVTTLIFYFKKQPGWLLQMGSLMMAITMVVYFSFISPVTNGRMNELKTSVEGNSAGAVHSTGMRLQAWKSAIQLIREVPLFGTGTGDVKDELVKKHLNNGFTEIYELQLNAHNQFLQTFGALGIVGFGILIVLLCMPWYRSFAQSNWVLFGFMSIVIFNMMIESILEVSAGALFFALFFSILLGKGKLTNKLKAN